MQLGVEIGATFTDLVWLDRDGMVRAGKVPSTPSQIEKAVLDAIERRHDGPAHDGRLSRHHRNRHT
jgi:N-methylhydantoinase A